MLIRMDQKRTLAINSGHKDVISVGFAFTELGNLISSTQKLGRCLGHNYHWLDSHMSITIDVFCVGLAYKLPEQNYNLYYLFTQVWA